VILLVALFAVLRADGEATPRARTPDGEARAAAPPPPPRLRAPMTDQPYVLVLVSTPDDAITAPRLVTLPDAYIDVRVVATPEDRRLLADILIEIRSQRLPAMLSEPIVLDARKF
jgi:hypothetical protein